SNSSDLFHKDNMPGKVIKVSLFYIRESYLVSSISYILN
ncbi:unnamed protein product, partial [marine sediment metagenome]